MMLHNQLLFSSMFFTTPSIHNKIKKGPALGRASQHFLLRAFAP